MRRPRLLPLAALAALLAFAPRTAAEAPPRVAAIEIEGAARTTRGTVLLLARVHEGDPWREGLDAEARRNLMNARLFYDVTVAAERAGDAVTLRIRLREKWSLVPFPFVSARAGETAYGFTVIESNLFGRAKSLFALLRVENGKPGGTLFYVDPHLGGTEAQAFASFLSVNHLERVWNATEEVGSYNRVTAAGAFALGYRLTPRTSLSAGLRVARFSFRDAAGAATLPEDARERALTARFLHDGMDYDEELRTGRSLTVTLERGAPALGDEVGQATLRGEARFEANPARRTTLGLALYGLATRQPAYDLRPATDFLRGYEAGRFRPDRLLGGSLEYRVPVARWRQATLSVLAFADAALLRDEYRRMTPEDVQADAGAGCAVYLRRVALPVLQLTIARGFSSPRALVGFSLGLTF